MPIFKRTFSQDLDLLEQHLTKDILTQTDCNTNLTNFRTKLKNAFNLEFKERVKGPTIDSIGKYTLEIILHQQRTPQLLKQKKLMQTQDDHSHPIPALNVDSLKVDLLVIQNTCSEKEDSNSETTSSKSGKESSLDSATKDVHAIKYKMSKAKERCMFTLDYDSQMTDKYFVEYTGIEVKHFKHTLLQHMGNVKKSVAERRRHKRQYDRRVNKRKMQTQKSKIDTSKAVDVVLVVKKSSGTESEVQDDNSRSGNDTDADDADIRPIYDEEPMAEVQLTAECNIFAIGQHHTKQPEIINEGQHGQILNETSNKAKIKKEIDVLETMNIKLEHKVANFHTENKTLKKHYKDLYDSIKIMRSKTIEQTTSLLANNADLKAQIQEKEVNSRAEIQSHKTRAINKLVDQKCHTQKPDRQIFTRHRWIPIGKLFDSYTSKVHSEPTHGSNVDIPDIHENKQTLDLTVGTSINVQKEQSLDFSADTLCNVNKESLRFKPRTTMSTKVPTTDMISMTMMIDLESLFGPSFDEYLNGEDQVVLKPSVVTTTDTSDKCQQQPDSTSSTSTLATTVTANGSFNL
nr:hypothetical protein [Tanacetum cinerariifolium]